MNILLVVTVILMVISTNARSERKEQTIGAYAGYDEKVVTSEMAGTKLGLRHSTTIRHDGASFLTIHFSHFNLRKGDRVVVRSPSNLERYEYKDMGRNQLGEFYSSVISGDVAFVEYYVGSVVPETTDAKYGFTIDQYSHGFPISESPESICGKDNSRPAKCYKDSENIYKNSKGVARLIMRGVGACTGWLVGCNGYLLTNYHCISSIIAAFNTDFELMGESASCSEECQSAFGCRGKIIASSADIIAKDSTLDYSLLKLKLNDGIDISKYHHLQVRPSGPKVDEPIYIPQHPKAWAKRIAKVVDDGSLARITSITKNTTCGNDLAAYMADTQGGSSGSPVISSQDHKVVALHQCGGCENTGIQISKIFNHLGEKFPKC